MALGFIEVALDGFLLLLSEHLRTLAGTQELLVVCLKSFDDTAVLIRAHVGQLRGNGEGFRLVKMHKLLQI